MEIAKLRLWLSLVVDEEDIRQIKPLPNLDYKIVCGNSLLGVKRDLLNDYLFKDLEKLKPLYFNETNPTQKQDYKKQIDDLIIQITNGHRDFDFEVYFSEVFHQKGGFDVVIANPPYVNVKRGIDAKEKDAYKKNYRTAVGQFDIFALFIERGLSLTPRMLTYIVPKPFINNENYESIRSIVLEKGLYKIVIGSDIFEAAGVESCVFFVSKNQKYQDIQVLVYQNEEFLGYNYLPKDICYKLPFKIISTELSKKDAPVMRKISENTKPLGDLVEIMRGVEAGKSDDSITKEQTPYKLITGEDLSKYHVQYRDLYIRFDERDPKKFKSKDLYQKNKILIRRVGKDLISTLDKRQHVVLNTIYCALAKTGKSDLRYITALLNSALISRWFRKVFVLTDKLFPYIRQSQLELIPIKATVADAQKPLIGLVDNILAITKDEDYLQNTQKQAKVKALEQEIDRMVYQLYGLTEKEIQIVEGKND